MSLITLALLIIDFGGQSFLAKATASLSETHQNNHLFRSQLENIWATVLTLRISTFITLLIIMAAFPTLSEYKNNEITEKFVYTSIPGLFFWCFNQVGILDGLKKHAISGLTNSLPWLAPSFYILASSMGALERDISGIALGIAFNLGVAFAVFIQFNHSKVNSRIKHNRINSTNLKKIAKESGGALLASIPGQLANRIQLTTAVLLFSEEISSAFIFSMTMIGGASNIVHLARRIDFPNLVILVNKHPKKQLTIGDILQTQKLSLYTSALGSCVIAFLFIISTIEKTADYVGNLSLTFELAAVYIPALLLLAVSGALIQYFLSIGKVHILWISSFTTLAIVSALSNPISIHFGVYGLPFVMYITTMINITILASVICKQKRESDD